MRKQYLFIINFSRLSNSDALLQNPGLPTITNALGTDKCNCIAQKCKNMISSSVAKVIVIALKLRSN